MSRSPVLPVDPDKLRWYAILCCYSMMVKCLATSTRVASLGRSHQDVLLMRLEGVIPIIQESLRTALLEVL